MLRLIVTWCCVVGAEAGYHQAVGVYGCLGTVANSNLMLCVCISVGADADPAEWPSLLGDGHPGQGDGEEVWQVLQEDDLTLSTERAWEKVILPNTQQYNVSHLTDAFIQSDLQNMGFVPVYYVMKIHGIFKWWCFPCLEKWRKKDQILEKV